MKQLKELGQNFLTDPSVAAEIASAAEIKPGERVWEIGPGRGILTDELLSFDPRLTVFELDRRLIPYLDERYGDRLTLIHGDILRQDWQALISTATTERQSLTLITTELQREQREDFGVGLTGSAIPVPSDSNPARGSSSSTISTSSTSPLKLVSNLPYQITSPLLELLQRYHDRFDCIVLMLQKEVAQRLQADPGSKAYGALTLRMGLSFDIETLIQVPRYLFEPVPKVDSTVIRLKPRAHPPQICKPEIFQRLIRMGFSSRRKTLRNNLRPLYDSPTLDRLQSQSGIDLSRRAETLSEAEFIRLSDLL
ncbi:MAG TPA: rRNA adenine dimethyltransferase family protein [Candidatus Cloacimonadota bacterium]|nr:rRNA adenine dimethyltransferase family protein [Candidatus Cloacimonadota bacterium]